MAGIALRILRAPINATASLLGSVGGSCCSSAAFERVRISENLVGLKALAPGADSRRIILYFHGGGHWLLTPETYKEFIGRLSAAVGACVIAVNYRKPPKVQFPAGLEDALTAWTWAAAEHPGAAVAVAGDSSGANLAFALVVKLAQEARAQPVACIGISPWLRLDLKDRWLDLGGLYGRFCASLYLGGRGKTTTAADPLVSPVNAEDEVVRRFPPVLMHAGRHELTTADVKEMADVCARAGRPAEVQFYRAPHIFQVTAGFPQQTRDSLGRIDAFLKRHW